MRVKFDYSFLSGDNKGPNSFKFEVFPVKRNKILVRFENIGDLFDLKNIQNEDSNSTYFVDVYKFA
jgi:hypothetical protein